MAEPREPDQEVTQYFSPQGKSQWFKRGDQPDGWTLDDSAAKELAAQKIKDAEAARQKEIDDAVEAELARRESGAKAGDTPISDPETNPDDSPLSEEEAKELADLQAELDGLDEEEKQE